MIYINIDRYGKKFKLNKLIRNNFYLHRIHRPYDNWYNNFVLFWNDKKIKIKTKRLTRLKTIILWFYLYIRGHPYIISTVLFTLVYYIEGNHNDHQVFYVNKYTNEHHVLCTTVDSSIKWSIVCYITTCIQVIQKYKLRKWYA